MTSRRSILCVPAAAPDKVAKALASSADEVVIDLEDAVAPERKAVAREVVRGLTVAGGGPRLAVRVNGLRTPWGLEDLRAVVESEAPFASVVLPKVESREDVAAVEQVIDGLAAAGSSPSALGVQALIETAAGVHALADVVSRRGRLEGLIIGYADLGASLGRRAGADVAAWVVVQQQVLAAARASGIEAVDGPHLGVVDDEEFRAAVAQVALAGFDSKWVIHPRQVDAVNAAFAPSLEEARHAQRIVDVLDDAHGRGAGAISLDGQLVDEAMAVAARRVLAKVVPA